MILLVFFVVLAVVGVLIFAGVIPTPGGSDDERAAAAALTMWGTFPRDEVSDALDFFNESYKGKYNVSYIEKNPDELELDLLRAIPTNSSPDLIFFPHDYLLTIEDYIYPISTDTLSERSFKETFVEGGEVFFGADGINALPVLIDPMVLFWNRDIFNNEKITLVPETWSDILVFAQDVTTKDVRGKVLRSAIPLGESKNISHFKDVLSLLIIQAGDDVVSRSPVTKEPEVVLTKDSLDGTRRAVAESALDYYIGFADPVKPNYSWNSSLPSSLDFFSEGSAALYVGWASDLKVVSRKNPHLNFDITAVPQLENASRDATFGRMYGIAVAKHSKKIGGAFSALFALAMSSDETLEAFRNNTGLPPAKRSMLGKSQTDPLMDTFYGSAVIARAWLDPAPKKSEEFFAKAVDNVLAKAAKSGPALNQVARQLGSVLQSKKK